MITDRSALPDFGGCSVEFLAHIANSFPDALILKDLQGIYLYGNHRAAELLECPQAQLIGCSDADFFSPSRQNSARPVERVVPSEEVTATLELTLSQNNRVRQFEARQTPLLEANGKCIGVLAILTELKSTQSAGGVSARQQTILERIAEHAPLNEILDQLIAEIETLCPGVMGSFLLLEEDGRTLRVTSGRSLDPEYNAQIDGVKAGPQVGSCGTAVWRGEPVRVHDIEVDPLWANYRHLAQRFGLFGCWSFPIRSRKQGDDRILGTFAVYSRSQGVLNDHVDEVIQQIHYLACIAIEQAIDHQTLRDGEARWRTFVENTADTFLLLRRGGMIVDVNEQACHHLGYTREELTQSTPMLFDTRLTQERHAEITRRLDAGEQITFETRHLRKDGREVDVEVRLSPFHQNGTRYCVASIRDITQRLEAEAGQRQQQMLLQESQTLAHLGSFEWDIATNRLTWSDELYRIYGYQPGEVAISIDRFLNHLHPDDRTRVESTIQAACRTGGAFRTEERIQRVDGEIRYLSSVGKVVTDENGVPLRLIGACKDMTDQKQAQAELESSQKLVTAMTQASPMTVYVFDVMEHRILHCTDQLLRDLGYTIDQFNDLTLSEISGIVHPDDAARFPELLKRWEQIRDGVVLESEFRMLDSSGQWHWIISRDTVLNRTESGHVREIIGIAYDTTARKQAELEMQRTVSRMIATLESTADGILVVDPEGRIVDFNHQFLKLWGMSDELINAGRKADLIARFNDHTAMQVVLSQLKDPAEFVRRVAEIYQSPNEASFDFFEFLNGRKVERYSQPQYLDGHPIGRVWSFRDVTARRTAERALQLTQFIVDCASDAVFWTNAHGRILYVNEAVCRTLECTRSELEGQSLSDMGFHFPGESWESHWRNLKAVETLTFESEQRTRSGRFILTEVTVNYLRFDEQEYCCAVMRDITLRKQTEAQRDRLWNESPDLLCIVNLDGTIRQMNPAWQRLMGWPPEDLRSKSWTGFVHPEDQRQTLDQLQKVHRGESVIDFVHRFADRQGHWHWLSWNIIPVLSEHAFYAFARDVTEARQLAEQFQQSQKMEAFGRLAGGVAHDFNNLLTVINGYAEMLLTDFSIGDPWRELITEIRRAGNRAAELTSQLLAFSRRSLVAPRNLDLNLIVESMSRMLKRLLGTDIQLQIRLQHSLPGILGDQGKLEQVLMNLAVNSRDAMPDGGCLLIETSQVHVPVDAPTDSETVRPGHYVCLSVTDTGEGMSEDVRGRIFEPFFTTKEVGKGTGLGLSVVHGIVSQFDGAIFVDSLPDRGTTISLYFPAASGPVESTVLTSQLPGRGRETVLLVEDDHAVRSIAVLALETAGFQVLTAQSGADALTLAAGQINQIDLIVTDLVMPRMNGQTLISAIREMRADLPVLYMSGYTEQQIGKSDSRSGFLQKPFTPMGLVHKARELLDAVNQKAPDR